MNSEKIQESQRRESFKSPRLPRVSGFEGTWSFGDSMAKKSLRSKRGPAPWCGGIPRESHDHRETPRVPGRERRGGEPKEYI